MCVYASEDTDCYLIRHQWLKAVSARIMLGIVLYFVAVSRLPVCLVLLFVLKVVLLLEFGDFADNLEQEKADHREDTHTHTHTQNERKKERQRGMRRVCHKYSRKKSQGGPYSLLTVRSYPIYLIPPHNNKYYQTVQ